MKWALIIGGSLLGAAVVAVTSYKLGARSAAATGE